jgi:RNA polymerase sigma-B factor
MFIDPVCTTEREGNLEGMPIPEQRCTATDFSPPAPSAPGEEVRVPDAPPRGHGVDLERLERLLRVFTGMVAGRRRDQVREHLVLGYLPVARRLAGKYRDRGVPMEDLVQVASIGLIKAIDRFSPDFESGFLAYAIPTMQGEIRRYFRDRTWSMRVPRALKDLHLAISAASPVLSARLGRAPRPSELATYLDLPLDAVLEGIVAGESYSATFLDQRITGQHDAGFSLVEVLGEADGELELLEYRDALQPLLENLPDRERMIIMLRFFGEMTQSDIAKRIGISQMHVSRLITRTLAMLRQQLEQADRDALA